MIWWRLPYNPGPYDDDWEDQPKQGRFFQWGLGIILPLLLATYGSTIIITRSASFGRDFAVILHSWNAIAFGAAWVSAALFLHCHYFWGNMFNQAWGAVLGKIIAAGGFIGGLGFLIVHNGMFGLG